MTTKRPNTPTPTSSDYLVKVDELITACGPFLYGSLMSATQEDHSKLRHAVRAVVNAKPHHE